MSTSKNNVAYIKLSQIYNSLKENKPKKSKSVYLDWGASEKNSSNIYQYLIRLDHTNYSYVIKNVLKDDGDINYQIPADSLVKSHEPDLLGYTALHFAVITSNVSGLHALLLAGADFTIQKCNQFTALRLAIETSFEKGCRCLNLKGTLRHPLVDLILDAHVSTGNPTNPKCRDGISHFHIACMSNNAKAVELFLSNGVDVNEAVFSDSYVVPGYTPLHFAARYCNLEVMGLLLNNGADRHPKDAKGMTPLHLLIEYKMEIVEATRGGKLSDCKWLQTDLNMIENMMKLLISGADDFAAEAIDDTGLTQLHVACMNSNVKKACFFSSSSLLDIYDTGEKSLSDDLKILSNSEMSEKILVDKIKITPKSDNVVKVVHRPSDGNAVEIHDPKMHVDSKEATNLMQVLEKIDTSSAFMKKMVDHADDIDAAVNSNSPLWQGYTPMHFAAHFNPFIFRYLCERKADMSIKDKRGVTPFDLYLENYGRKNLYAILSSYDDLRDIRLSDGTKLIDAVSLFPHVASLSQAGVYVQLDSPLWAGYTMLHLAVAGVKKAADKKVFDKVDHSTVAQDTRRESNDGEEVDAFVEDCLRAGANLTMTDANGMTPLHLALRQGKQQVVQKILARCSLKLSNLRDREGLSHFHIAVCANRTELFAEFAQLGVDFDSPTGSGFVWRSSNDRKVTIAAGSTPLHIAVARESQEAVVLLLSRQADPRIKNSHGLTPLQLAFVQNSWGLMQLLLSDDRVREENATADSGLSDFHIACHSKNLRAVLSYLRAGVDVNGAIAGKATDHARSADFHDGDDCSDYYSTLAPYAGFTALHFAVQSKSLEIVGLLVQHGADVDAKNDKGLTPLCLALIDSNNSSIKKYILKLLRDRSGGIEEIGLTSLHLACMRLDKAEVRASLESGADVNARVSADSPIFSGHTPLHVLIDFDHDDYCGDVDEIAELLLEHGADVTILSNDQTPLHCAYEILNSNLQKILLKNHRVYDVNPVNYEGFSHFHIACTKDDPSVVEEFLKRGVDVGHTTDHYLDALAGYTPLHFAITESCSEVIEVLVRYGIDVDARDSNGSTPLHVAVEGPGVKIDNVLLILSTGKADINARNVHGKTPLESLVTSLYRKEIDNYYVHLFLTNGALVNTYNPTNSEGLLGVLFRENAKINRLMNVVMQYATDLDRLDPESGNNAVHNVVSIRSYRQPECNYACALETMLEKGCALDHRNFAGKTPLHTAMQYRNRSAVGGLLMLGADINVADLNGSLPFHYCNGKSSFAKETSKDFAWHVHKLTMFDIHVNDENRSMYDRVSKALGHTIFGAYRNEKSCLAEFERVKQAMIKDRPVPIYHLLSDRGVAAYPTMPLVVREEIDQFFQRRKMLFQNYVNLGGLLLLQHRKARERVSLMKDAKEALMILADCGLPDPCTEGILKNLRNEDLKSAIVVKDEFVNPIKRRRVDG